MASEPKSWGAVLCGCLPWSGQPESPDSDQAMHQLGNVTPRPDGVVPQSAEAAPNSDDTAPKPNDTTPKPPVVVPNSDEVVPGPSEAVLQPDETAPRPDEAKPRLDEVAPPDKVTPDSGEAAPITTTADASGGSKTKDNAALGVMKLAMKGLHEALDVFPPLKIAVGGLLECTTRLQIVDQNRQEYEQLISRLADLASLLQKHLSDSKPTYMPYSIENVARAIEEQVRHIQERQGRSGSRQLATAREDEDDILGCYRRVETLFQQLQTDISLSIWDVVQKEQMENHMQRLLPADDAWYNSALSASMTKRRGCTQNTRTEVLAGARDWTQDEDAAKIYWMNGMAGTGKTTIAYSLCKRLEDDKQLGASFFCSRDSPTCRDVNKIVPTLAYQLARYSNPYRKALCDVLSNDADAAKKDIGAQFDNLIVKSMRRVKNAIPTDVVVVIDALDECVDAIGTQHILNLLFRHATELPIKFFVTSRPDPNIADTMTGQDSSTHSILHLHNIEQSLVEADIRTYLTEELQPINPLPEHIERLVARAGRLFIFAATVVRYISPLDKSADHEERLSAMLKTSTNDSPDYEDIDLLYKIILSKTLEEGRPKGNERSIRRLVLWTVVCAREPMTMSTLAEVLRIENERKVKVAIQPLRSVLHVSESNGVVSTLHASFPDFLLSETRAGSSLYCHETEHNKHLATRCFEVMKGCLRFNICGLESSFRFDKDVPNLQDRVNNAISSGLFYTCRYWGDHLARGTKSPELLQQLEEFLQSRLLFWMEVLNLKGRMIDGENVLQQALNRIPTDDERTNLRQFTYDACSSVAAFAGNPISLSTPHIYISMLPFISKRSHVWINYRPRTQGLVRVEGTAMEARSMVALATYTIGSAVKSISQSSDGKRIVCGSDDGTVSIWDVSKGTRIVGPLQSRQRRAGTWRTLLSYGPHVVFSPDDTHIASGSEDCTIRIWASHNGELIVSPLEGHSGPVLSIAFSPDGTRLVSGSEDCTIRMWDAHNGNQLGDAFNGHDGSVTCVAYSPDGKQVVSGSIDKTIQIWDPLTGATILGPLDGHTGWVRAVAFSGDGLRVVSGSGDRTIRVWDAKTGTAIADPFKGHTNWVTSVAFSPDGVRVASGSRDNIICLWDAQNGTLIAAPPLAGHRGCVNSVLFSTEGARILSGSDDGTICVWDARHGAAAAAKSSGHTGAIYLVAFSPDGTRAVSGSLDRTIRVWDTRDGRLVLGPLEGHADEVGSVAFSPDGAQIASGSDDCTIRTWDAHSGASIAGPFEGHTKVVWSVAYSPHGDRLVSGSDDHTIRVWHSQTGKLAAEPFTGHTHSVRSVGWSPDGTRIVSGSVDNTIRMWNAHDGTSLWISDAHGGEVNCVAFSPDGTRVVSGSNDCMILVLGAGNGTVLHDPFEGHTDGTWWVAFSPDGTRIVSGSLDKTVCVWDSEKGTVVAGPFKGHADGVRSVAFSPDARRIVSCSEDRTIRFWEVPTADKPHPTYFDHCTVRDDGWLTDSDSQLLMWLPPDLRTRFPLPSAAEPFVISPDGIIRADYNDLLLGEHWKECYHDSATRPMH